MNDQIDWREIVRTNARQIVEFATTFCGRPYSYREFNCWHFIRAVYGRFGIPMTPGAPIEPITDFDNPGEIGKLVFLKRRGDTRGRRHTHIAIYIGQRKVIHNTFYLGKRVVVSTLEEILEHYDIVEHPEFLSHTKAS